LRIEEFDKGEVVLLKVYGRLMGGPDADTFKSRIGSIIAEGKNKVVVDLGRVSWINSTGLGILLSAQSTLRRNGGELKLANVTSRIKNIMFITKLTLIFECFDSVEEAIESF